MMTTGVMTQRFSTGRHWISLVEAPRGAKCEVCGFPIYRGYPCYLVRGSRENGFPQAGEGDLMHRECLEVKGE
ncbi:hypothetical protein ABFB09_02695 [Dehalogenimonas sp. THU2]|uniref:hypothetical protein n=1 Tax=Dehalogenimonas sp. THU2 TaxID=3151121 RepID=UPI00321898CF